MTSTNWIAAIAALISFASLLLGFKNYLSIGRWAKSNKEFEMSKILYNEYLLNVLPKAFDQYALSINLTVAGKELSTTLKSFRRDIRYFKYSHQAIYDSIFSSLEKIDNQITKGTGPIEFPEQKNEIIQEIANEFDNIYKAFLFELPSDRIEKYFKK
ncbi:hypothetical protein [Leuconostoc mesenteroides]|nr:hypothetical protein [Leuconostoc mesenteroides]